MEIIFHSESDKTGFDYHLFSHTSFSFIHQALKIFHHVYSNLHIVIHLFLHILMLLLTHLWEPLSS